jgi:hypothetical protein
MKRQFPGVEVKDRETISRIVECVDRLSAVHPRRPVNVVEAEALLSAPLYLLLYKHPVHDFKDRLFKVERSALRAFVRAEFRIDRMEGVDIMVPSPDMESVLIGNHDGGLFVLGA